MKAFFLTILLACSACTKYSPLTTDAMGLRLLDVTMDISHLNQIEWNVGKHKEVSLTQSFVFLVDMPNVKEENLEHMTETKGINAWILRLIVQRGSEKQDLGSLYAPFKAMKITRGKGGGAPSNVSMKVYYAAAYPSERFRQFNCPAFNHDKKINNMKIVGEPVPFDMSLDQTFEYAERSQLVELTPSAFNGGNSLAGEYFVEIAPYNYNKKVIHGSFKRLSVSVKILEEKTIQVKSCAGENPEMQ